MQVTLKYGNCRLYWAIASWASLTMGGCPWRISIAHETAFRRRRRKKEEENNGDESKKDEDKANDSDDSEGTSASVLAARMKKNAHDLGLSWGEQDANPPKKKKKGAQKPESPSKNVRDNLKSLRN